MELSSPKIKKVIIFSQENLFLYFGKWNLLRKTSYISRVNFPSSKNKKIHSEKISYVLASGIFSYIFRIFWEMQLSSPKINILAPGLKSLHIFSKKSFSYISGGISKAPKT